MATERSKSLEDHPPQDIDAVKEDDITFLQVYQNSIHLATTRINKKSKCPINKDPPLFVNDEMKDPIDTLFGLPTVRSFQNKDQDHIGHES